ncbi:hypothetical protein AB1Y20_006911 [Prymnesium parvum]|uniref:V-SNARE coiled-coil homology domain-containing protein n=1 Tax=Prymnesium parvum TaxID=97485 RepID=A0AB34J1Z5_PRYPA
MLRHVAFVAVGRLEEYGQCTFLADVAFTTGNMGEIAMKILRRLPVGSAGVRRSYKYESGYTFHFLCDSSLVFVATERELGAEGAFALLVRVQQKWLAHYGNAARLIGGDVSSYRDFERTLHELVQSSVAERQQSGPVCTSRAGGSRTGEGGDEEMEELGAVQEKLEGIKSVMADSIEKVLERGEKIDLLVDKTDRLHQQAFKFARSSTAFKRSLRWRSIRCMLASLTGVFIVLVLLRTSYCGTLNVSGCVNSVKVSSEEWFTTALKDAKEPKHPL